MNSSIVQILILFGVAIINLGSSTPTQNKGDVCAVSEQFAAACSLGDYVPYIAQLQNPKKLQELEQSARTYADSIKFHHEMQRSGWISEPISPFTLLPSRVPRKLFDQAFALQPWLNLLYFRAATDYEFLQEAAGEMAKSDDLVKTILDIIAEVANEGGYKRQPIVVNWQRADYMFNLKDKQQGAEDAEIKQIEVNAGAAGGLSMACKMTKIHRHTLSELKMDTSLAVLPHNNSWKLHVEALHLAWRTFEDPDAVVLSITHRTYRIRAFKEEWYQGLFLKVSGGKMKFEYMGLEDCADKLILDPKDFSLRIKEDGRRVAIVEYRLSPFPATFPRYDPPSDKLKNALRMIERSSAIKAPSVGYFLMNLKKVQQVLAKPGNVERFFTDPREEHFAKEIRNTFAGLWGLDKDDAETKEIIKDAIAHPEKYVLKPSKEGGGNNFYGQQIVDNLKAFGPAERATHILQEKIIPPVFQNFIVEPFDKERVNPLPRFGTMATEISAYGMLVGNVQDGTVLYNQANGYLMRTKWAEVDEGGIMNGNGFYDTPYLY